MLAAATSAAVIGGWRFLVSQPSQLFDALLDTLDGASAETIANELISLRSEYNDAHALRAALEPIHSTATTLSEVKSNVTRAIYEDFKSNKTIKVGGWVLSQTEAQLYALRRLELSRS
jgi:hypothetical protein